MTHPHQHPEENELPFSAILPIFIALILSILLAALDQTIVSTALPTIAGELHGFNKISWLITAYLLAQTVSVPLYGKLGDMFGRKRLLLSAIVLFLVGSALCGLAQDMNQLIGFRALQGLGAGGLMVSALAIIGDVIPARKRGKYMGVMMPIFGLATAFGPTLGGFLIDNFSWRWIFYVNMPIGILAILAVSIWLKLPEREVSLKKIDYIGAILLAGATSSLVLIVSWAGNLYSWGSWQILSLFAAMVLLGTFFIFEEKRAEDPVFPLELFKNRIFLSTVALGSSIGLGLFGVVTFLPTFLQIVLGASPTDSGLLMLPFSAGLMVAAITAGQLMSRTGRYKIFPLFGTAVAAIGMYLFSTLNATTPQLTINIFMVILGMGIGSVMPVLTLVAQNSVKREELGVATSGVNFFRQIGGALGVSIAGTLFTTRLHTELTKELPGQAASMLNQSGSTTIDPSVIAHLPPQIHTGVVTAFGHALPSVFFDFIPVFLVAFIVAWFLKEIPLSTTSRFANLGSSHSHTQQQAS
ncbi:MAG TPA: DHA2 family efflux MFS transporter permease subunit [Candidatus Paceibacterota bacterium]|nr:DHA2 family efflux MFS transporter permease subunit [Candidatus Paceibacterota bacterium]